MALSRYAMMKQYSISQDAAGRNYGGLTNWSAMQLAEAIPPSPTDDWIRLRLMAERVPQTPDAYVSRIASYMLQVPEILNTLTLQMAPYLEDADASTVQQAIDNALVIVMPQLAKVEITQAMVDQWRIDNGYPAAQKAGAV
jgi:hypothetical protein